LFEPEQRAPYPALAALGTATYALGQGDCLGTLALADKDCRAIAFARGEDTAAVAVWRESDEPAEVILPLDWQDVRDARTHLGTPVMPGEGPVHVRVARGAVYLLLPHAKLEGKLTPPARSPIKARGVQETPADEHSAMRDMVVRLRVMQGTPDKAIDAYRVQAGAVTQLQAELYNFGSAAFTGELQLTGPEDWKVEPASATVTVAPGDRTMVPVKLSVPPQKEPVAIRLFAKSAAAQSAPAVVRVCADVSSLTPPDPNGKLNTD
jgi:hypothetical protein